MKVVYLMRFWPVYGGGETVTRILVNELSSRSNDVMIIYLWDRNNQTTPYLNENIKTVKLNGITNLNDGDIGKRDKCNIRKQLTTIFEKENFDIIVNQWLPSQEVYKAAQNTGSKVIKCHHGVVKYVPIVNTLKQKIFYGIFGEKGGWLRVYWQRKQDYDNCDKWVFLSNSFVDDAKKLLGKVDEKKLCAIGNPLHYEIPSETIDFSKKTNNILYVGRMIELKRVHFLLDVWSDIQDEELVQNWTFTLVGDGVTLNDEKEYAKKINCKRVEFTGFQDPRPYYEKADILTMASNSEGFGMVLVEAQQYGCVPVALDSFSAVHDIIENGRNGVLVEDSNREKYGKELLELIRKEDIRRTMAKNALQDCKKFSVKNIVDQWENLFREVVTE